MKKSFLFPHWCQKAGWWIAAGIVGGLVLLLILSSMNPGNVVEAPQWAQSLLKILLFFPSIALMLICLSKEKNEDEYIGHIRARSVFVVVLIAFIAEMISVPITRIGVLWYSPDFVGTYTAFSGIFTSPVILTIIYLIIFKGTLFANWLKTRNDGQ